jgi:pimeloyl-ACP methyl ester carboxylesterase
LEPNFEALAASAFETIGVGGIPIRCLRTGSGQPLLLIHTLRTQSDYFARIVPKLRQHFEVHLLDLPGHGHSAAPTVAYTADFFLHVVREFVATRKLKDFVVAGESIGATLALALGAESSSVTRVVALNPFDYRGFGWIARRSWMTWLGFFGLRTPGIGRVVSSLTPRALLRKVLQGGLHDPRRLPESLVDELHAAGNRSGHSRAFHSLCRSWNSWAGHGGGWSLARKLDDVTLADVYDALGLSAPFNIAHQQKSPKCLHERAANRALAEALAEAEALLVSRFRGITVADVLAASGHKSVRTK